MPIKTICPGCRRQINAPEAAGGRTAKCPACGVLMVIPPAIAEAFVEPLVPPQSPMPPQSFQTQPPSLPVPVQSPRKFSRDDEDERPIERRPRSRRQSRSSNFDTQPVTPSFGISALVVSIVSFVTCWVPFIGLALSGLAILLAICSFARRESAGFAVAGLVMSFVGGLFAGLVTFGFIAAAAASHDADRMNRGNNAPWVR